MTVLPILFNTQMVKAIMEGRKTQTRRLIKPQPTSMLTLIPYRKWGSTSQMHVWTPPACAGDVLWVREAWRTETVWQGSYIGYEIAYKAGGKETFAGFPPMLPNEKGVWRPSIHMPKEAARIFLRVTGVGTERLHDMTDRDAEEEGIGTLYLEDVGFGDKDYGCMKYLEGKGGYVGLQVEQFAHLWDSTIKKPDIPRSGWEANPWVWVIRFEKIDKPAGWLA